MEIIIGDKKIPWNKVFRDVKYARLEMKLEGLVVVLPPGYKQEEELLHRHKKWILHRHNFLQDIKAEASNLSIEETLSPQEFRNEANKLVKEFAEELKVRVEQVTIRKMRSKWGSCRKGKEWRQGRITLNSLLRFLPEDLIHYILFHEVAHILEWGHTPKFYRIMETKFRDIKKIEKLLSVYWFALKTR